MKVSIFKLAGWAFDVRDEINKAYADDNAISVKEMLDMYQNLNKKIDLPVDEKAKNIMNLISDLITEIDVAVEDNKITIAEVVTIAETVCEKLGFDLDTKGIEIPKIEKK